MPPKSSKEERKAARAERKANKSGTSTANNSSADSLVEGTQKLKLDNNRSATGVLTSQKDSRDIKVLFNSF